MGIIKDMMMKQYRPQQTIKNSDELSLLNEIMNMDIPDEYETLLNMHILLEEFTISTYISHMALISLLLEKGVITKDEYDNSKLKMYTVEEIKMLYEGLNNKKELLQKKVDI